MEISKNIIIHKLKVINASYTANHDSIQRAIVYVIMPQIHILSATPSACVTT